MTSDSDLPKVVRTREELIEAHLSDDDIVLILTEMKRRASEQGDVMAAKLLLEFKFGKNPEPVSTGQTLEDLMLQTPLADGNLSSE